MEIKLLVTGMHCPACEALIRDQAQDLPGLVPDSLQVKSGLVRWETDTGSPAEGKAFLNQALDPLGYRFFFPEENPKKQNHRELLWGLLWGGLFLGFFSLIQALGLFSLNLQDGLTVPTAFFLGIMASVSSCFALVGGLLVSFSAGVGRRRPQLLVPALGAFHLSRLMGFFLLGGLIGFLGAEFSLAPEIPQILTALAAGVMVTLGVQLLGIFPSRGQVKLWNSHARAQKTAAAGTLISGVFLGILTFFLPCGFTLSVQFQALTSGGFMEGGFLLLSFALGTLPVLLGVSALIKLGLHGKRRAILLKACGVVVLGLASWQIWGLLTSLGWIRL